MSASDLVSSFSSSLRSLGYFSCRIFFFSKQHWSVSVLSVSGQQTLDAAYLLVVYPVYVLLDVELVVARARRLATAGRALLLAGQRLARGLLDLWRYELVDKTSAELKGPIL